MIKYILLILFNSISIPAISQEVANEEKADITFFGRNFFLIEGTVIADSLKESPYDRLPFSYKEKVREPVWTLSKCSAGISVRFLSNSTRIKLKWTVLNDAYMNHMAATGIKGIDLYVKDNDQWRYVNTARPSGVNNEAELIKNITQEFREYKMFLPLYDGITDLEVGIDTNSLIKKSMPNKEQPIVFYGTSITQGGCASRPGMAHTNIISRKLGIDCINFGFSGNGRMEKAIVELISEIDASIYVIECLQNMDASGVMERTLPTVEIIRKKHFTTPIIFVENIMYESAFLDKNIETELNHENLVLHNEYKKILEKGFQNIFYIDNNYSLQGDHEGTVDGVHLTDLGFLRYADHLIKNFKEFNLILRQE